MCRVLGNVLFVDVVCCVGFIVARFNTFRTRARCCDYVIGQIYAVGGLTKNGDSVSTVEIYDPKTKEWKMGEAMSMLR